MERIERDMHRSAMNDGIGRRDLREPLDDASIGELFKQLTSDASMLVRQEISLATAEVKESATQVKNMATKLAIAAAFAIPGVIAFTAFLVIALGQAIDSYWASALIVGVIFIGTAGILARQAMAKVTNGKVGLTRTATSLGEDARWGKEELRAFKRELTA